MDLQYCFPYKIYAVNYVCFFSSEELAKSKTFAINLSNIINLILFVRKVIASSFC